MSARVTRGAFRGIGTLLLLTTLACGAPDGTQDELPPRQAGRFFTEVAERSGIRFSHRSGAAGDFRLPEIMAGGAGFLDYDGDGFLDLYLVQSGRIGAPDPDSANVLYRNDGAGGFEDVTALSGVGDAGYGMGCAAGDVDNDGDLDLYVTNLGVNVLYRNDGAGGFDDVTRAAGVGGDDWSTSAAFVDYDADGDLDLFVANYVNLPDPPTTAGGACFSIRGTRDYCSPQAYDAPSFDTLYRNEGDGSFTDVSAEAGLRARAGTGLGVVCTDLDGDGRVDIYVANDQMPSFAWINEGDGRFSERAVTLGIAVDEGGRSQAGMGVASVDIDEDGDFDLWKVHLHRESHILYLNENGFFDDATSRWGLVAPTLRHTGFGTGVVDLDLDGRLDIFVANGRVQHVVDQETVEDVYAEPNQLLLQDRPGRFVDAGSGSGAGPDLVENSRAAAFGDYDNDGDIDVLVANRDGPARLLRNDAERRGGFLTLRLVDRSGRDAYGARVSVRAGERVLASQVLAAYSYCATNDPRVHFGLGSTPGVDAVEVRWPDGSVASYGPFEANRFVELRQASPASDTDAWKPQRQEFLALAGPANSRSSRYTSGFGKPRGK